MNISIDEMIRNIDCSIDNCAFEPLQVTYKEKIIVIIDIENIAKKYDIEYNDCTDSCTAIPSISEQTTVCLKMLLFNDTNDQVSKKGKNHMRAINYTNVRENLKSYCDLINDDSETIIVTRKNNRNIVMISEDAYNNMLENMYLRQSKTNYDRLLAAKDEVESGLSSLQTIEL